MISTVVGYGGFKSYGDKPYSHLKPGQKELDRDYYGKATHEQPNGQACLTNYGRFDSIYNQNIAATVKPGDFKVPSKNANTMVQYEFAHNPELFNHTRLAKQENMRRTFQAGSGATQSHTLLNAGSTSVGFNKDNQVNPTSHWKTTYQGVVEETLSQKPSRAQRPQWSLPRQAYTSQRSYFNTEYMKSIGTYGYNPRDKLNATHTKFENECHELTIGTTKTTRHIPGYNGYIPKTDLNPTAVQHGTGLDPRTTIIKNNIVENYSVKIPGYQGHKPMSVVNDRGTLRPNCLTTAGETYH